MHSHLLAMLGSACLALSAVPATAQSSHSPSKMQRCQAELAGVQGNERKLQLRQCLVNRTEGERLANRDCAKQLRELPPDPEVDKTVMQRKCVATALNVAHALLPKRVVATKSTDAPSYAAATVPAASSAPAVKTP